MDFVQATTRLIGGITLEDVANEIGVSRGLIGQSRLARTNPQYRRPPEGWESVVEKLARRRATELARLADQLGNSGPSKRPARRSTAKSTRKKAARRRSR
jgi:transcriptional regulator with XRE-family HTH domain